MKGVQEEKGAHLFPRWFLLLKRRGLPPASAWGTKALLGRIWDPLQLQVISAFLGKFQVRFSDMQLSVVYAMGK